MNLKTRDQLVLMPRSSQYPVLGLISLELGNPKMELETLGMENAYLGIKNSIESFSHVENISIIINISIKYANDARIDVIDFKK